MTAAPRITEASLPAAVAAVAALDPAFARAVAEAGPPPLRYSPPGFSTLLRIIVAQQVSLASAAAIWARLSTLVEPLEPARLLTFSEERLCAAGLSRPKARYARSLAELLETGGLDLQEIDLLDDEAAIERLVRVKGLGRWSAECYLLFSHGRPDVFPADDVGIMQGLQRLKGLPVRPAAAELRLLSEAWRPWRAVAARLLWHYRRFDRETRSEGAGVA